MEQASSEWLLQLEMDGIISDLDPRVVDQLVEALSRDIENNDPQFNHELSGPASDIFTVGRMSSLNFSQDEQGAPSHGVISWGVKEEESIDLKILEKSSAKASSSRLPHYAQEHVLAERKRREKMQQQFVALSTLVPELKKTDKVSLLEGAIDYLKTLQQKVENMAEEVKRREQTYQPSLVLRTDDNNRNNQDEIQVNSESLPNVEASLVGNNILIRIQCEKRKGALVMVLAEIEKLSLSVINTTVVQFGSSLNMTITTEKEEGFTMTLADVISNLNSAIRRFQG